jgi:hypothetical protein
MGATEAGVERGEEGEGQGKKAGSQKIQKNV